MPQAIYAPVHQQAEGDPRLAQLAAIAQIYGGLNGQANQQGQNQQQNALAILGLMLQHEHQQELLGIQKSGQEQNQNQFLAQQTQSQAELGAKNTWEQQKLEAEKQASTQHMRMVAMQQVFSDPQIPLSQKQAMASALGDPMISNSMQAMHQSGVQTAVQQQAPAFAGVYQANANNPDKLHQAIAALKMGMPEEVFNNQNWDSLNQSLAGPQTNASGVAPTTPEAVMAQRGDQRTGGLFGAGGTFDLRDQTPPAVIAQRNAYQQAHPEVVGNPPGILDWLLGKNKNVGSIYK